MNSPFTPIRDTYMCFQWKNNTSESCKHMKPPPHSNINTSVAGLKGGGSYILTPPDSSGAKQ